MADVVTQARTMNGLIHQAVKRDQRRFESALAGFAAGDRARAGALADLFGRHQALLTEHHEGEDTHLWPVLRGNAEDTAEVQQLSTEHDRIVTTLEAAGVAVRRLGSTAAAEDAATARAAVAGLRAAAEDHFAHEERDITALMTRADPERLRAAVRQLGRGGGFAHNMWFLQWIADDASAENRAFLRRLIPPPAHWLSALVAGRKYARITRAAVG